MQIDVSGTGVELTEKQLELYGELTTLQQDVVLLKLTGMTNRDAYLYGGGTADPTNLNSVDACASSVLGDSKVRAFIAEMRNVKFASTIMSRDEMAARLSALSRTNIADIVNIHDGATLTDNDTGEIVEGQTFWSLKSLDEMTGAGLSAISELTAGKEGLKVKTHSQLAATKQLAELLGYNKPQQLEVSISKSLDDLYDDFDNED